MGFARGNVFPAHGTIWLKKGTPAFASTLAAQPLALPCCPAWLAAPRSRPPLGRPVESGFPETWWPAPRCRRRPRCPQPITGARVRTSKRTGPYPRVAASFPCWFACTKDRPGIASHSSCGWSAALGVIPLWGTLPGVPGVHGWHRRGAGSPPVRRGYVLGHSRGRLDRPGTAARSLPDWVLHRRRRRLERRGCAVACPGGRRDPSLGGSQHDRSVGDTACAASYCLFLAAHKRACPRRTASLVCRPGPAVARHGPLPRPRPVTADHHLPWHTVPAFYQTMKAAGQTVHPPRGRRAITAAMAETPSPRAAFRWWLDHRLPPAR